MIIPDLNLLIHAHNSSSKDHLASREWWRETLNGAEAVGLPWVVLLGFLRVSTNRHVYAQPWSVAEAGLTVRGWLGRRRVMALHPGDRHAEILFGLLENVGVAGNLTTDAHIAALAIEHGARVASTDHDFARFEGARWFNPVG